MRNPILSIKDWLDSKDLEQKFSPADESVNWSVVQPLVHGPAAWAPAVTGDNNSAVFACLRTLSDAAIEPRLRVYRDDGSGQPEPQDNHPLQSLLDDPNPVLMPEEVWYWLYWALHTHGNAYLLKLRGGARSNTTGAVSELWPISPTKIRAKTDKDSNDFISRYEIMTRPGQWEPEPPENIIHFRFGLDDSDMRYGMSPLRRLIRSISTDDECDKFMAVFLGNYATPGLVVETPDKEMTEDKAQTIKRRVAAEYSSDGRGNVGVLSNGAKIHELGSGLSNITLEAWRQVPEARICAVIGVPPSSVGLTVGLEQTSNYASSRQMNENFTERKLVPLWRWTGAKLSHSSGLRDDFLASDRTLVVRADLSTVRALQEDEDARHNRYRGDYAGGVITLEEARSALGYESEPNPEETMLVASTATPTLAGDLIPEEVPVEGFPLGGASAGVGGQPSGDGAAMMDGQDQQQGKAQRRVSRSVLARYPKLLDAMIELQAPALEADIQRFLNGQRRRVNGALRNGHS